ncbi:hypothetical protein GBA52_000981 [Prunus armeniaca]|nr:hypothetical protein GBA52_000981 [Prunus armeniaca]
MYEGWRMPNVGGPNNPLAFDAGLYEWAKLPGFVQTGLTKSNQFKLFDSAFALNVRPADAILSSSLATGYREMAVQLELNHPLQVGWASWHLSSFHVYAIQLNIRVTRGPIDLFFGSEVD